MLRRAKKRENQVGAIATDENIFKLKASRSKKTVKNARIATLGDEDEEDAEEAKLAKAVLGGEEIIVNTVLGVNDHKLVKSDGSDSDSSSDDDGDDGSIMDHKIGVLDKEKIKPAWEDEDDEQISVPEEVKGHHSALWKTHDQFKLGGKELKKRLKSQFEKTVGSTPSWAQLKSEKKKSRKETDRESEDSDSDSEDENQFLRQTGDYLTSSQQLPKNNLNYQKVRNANKERPIEGRVSSVQFHPSSQVLLTAGEDQNLVLFQVDGKLNPMIQTVHMDRFPISRARFSADGMEVIMSSRYRHFFVYDMMGGNITRIPNIKGTQEKRMMKFEVSPDGKFVAFIGSYGHIYLLSAKNKELIDTLKMNGSASAMAFTPDGTQLLSFGDDGEVYVWDISTRNCVHKFIDEGCINGTSIAIARNNQYIACGCDSGVVNIYDQSCLTEAHPKPLKSVMNLVTSATSATFNHTNEVLAISSRFTQNACKMVHLPSYQVFPNFPAFNKRMGCADCLDISPHSGYLTIGNSKGEALLYRLKHFTDY